MTLVRRSSTAVLLMAGLVAGPIAPAGATSVHPPLTVGSFRATVSPDGDGFHDRLRIPVRLATKATVRLRVVDASTGDQVASGCLAVGGGCRAWSGRRTVGWGDLDVPREARDRPATFRLTLTAVDRDGQRVGQARTSFRYFPGLVSARAVGGGAFSPDGDGVRDRVRVGYVLERRSVVTAVVRRSGGGVVHRVALGGHPAGRSVWTWGGRGAQDGPYDVTVVARPVGSGHARGQDTVGVTVDTASPDPTVRLNRATVYPRATIIRDSLRVGVDLPRRQVRGAQVRTPGGDLVQRVTPQAHECVWGSAGDLRPACTLLTWSARAGGDAVPSGSYVLRLDLQDDAGNRRVVRREVTVSDAQLDQHTGSVTWSALDAPDAYDFCAGEHCIYESACATVASARFPRGVSFRYDPELCLHSWQTPFWNVGFTPDLPSGSTPYDRFRVTATGGPTEPGADDVGYLRLSRPRASDPADGPSVDLVGDSTTSTPWTAARPDVELFPEPATLPGGGTRMRWRAGTWIPEEYDIASYTLEYTYYAPDEASPLDR